MSQATEERKQARRAADKTRKEAQAQQRKNP